MWLTRKIGQYYEHRARRYLRAYPELAMQILQRDPVLASQAIEQTWELQAARGEAPSRETFQYPGLNYLGYSGRAPGLRTVPKPTSYMLRMFSEKPPARRAINCIANPILDLPFQITLRRPVYGDNEPMAPTDDQRERIIAATEMLERPNNDQNGREFLEMVLEDIIVLGAGAVEVQDNGEDARPLFLFPVDAQSIRINANWCPGSKEYRYSQGYGYFYSAIETVEHVRLMDNEMMYVKLNPRTSSPFGFGYLEVAFDTVNAFLGAFDFATRRASNSTPQFGIFLGENTTSEQLYRFRHYWENDIEGYGKIPIIAGGRQPSVFQFASAGTDPLWLNYQEWLVRIIAMAFGLSPMRLGLERDINRSTAEQGSQDDWSTISPVANLVRDYYTQWLLWKRLGWTDLEFQWITKNQDDLKQAQVVAEQWNADVITVNEARKIYNRPPLPDGIGEMTKTAYTEYLRAAAQATFAPKQAPGGFNQAPQQQPPQKRKKQPNDETEASAVVTPFDDEGIEGWSPGERAVVREIVRWRDAAG